MTTTRSTARVPRPRTRCSPKINCNGDGGDSESLAAHLCSDIKDAGITVYTVGFQTSTAAANFLKDCATDRAALLQRHQRRGAEDGLPRHRHEDLEPAPDAVRDTPPTARVLHYASTGRFLSRGTARRRFRGRCPTSGQRAAHQALAVRLHCLSTPTRAASVVRQPAGCDNRTEHTHVKCRRRR